MAASEGTRAATLIETGFRKETEAQTPLGRIGQI